MCLTFRGQKFHLSAYNNERNLERTSDSSQSTHPAGRVLWEELPGEVILHNILGITRFFMH